MSTRQHAKTMAATLRQVLAARHIALSHSQCLEIIARQLGLADWNTLSARLLADETTQRAAAAAVRCSFCGKAQHAVRSLIRGRLCPRRARAGELHLHLR